MTTEAVTSAWRETSARTGCDEHLMMWQALLEVRLPHMSGRAARMDVASRIIGAELGMSADELYALSLAARFHDIGLLGVPDALILKDKPLNPEEQTRINEHADWGGRLVAKAFPDFHEGIEGIWFHHERPDGKGPLGLKDNEIPVTAAIVVLADAVEAMANDRPGHQAMTLEQIVAFVRSGTDTQFSRKVAAAFLRTSREVYQALAPDQTEPSADRAASPESSTDVPEPSSDQSQRQLQSKAADESPDAEQAAAGDSISAGPGLPAAHASVQPASDKSLNDLLPVTTQEKLYKLIKEGLNLKPLAPTVSNVMAATQGPTCSVEDIAREITLDQALSVRLLKLANSSAYWRGRRVENVKAAVVRIGTQTVRKLVMTLDIVNQYKGLMGKYIDIHHFWEHSIGCGLVASAIGRGLRVADYGDYFLLGIVHDVGRLILLDHAPEQYTKVLEAAEVYNRPLEALETRVLTLNHCDILRHALQEWRFGPEFIVPVVSHHRSAPHIQRLGQTYFRKAATVVLADQIAHALLLGSSGNNVIYPLDDMVELLKLPLQVLTEIEQGVIDETKAMKFTILARAGEENWPELLPSVRKRLDTEIRPICVSLNLGIIYMRNVMDQAYLIEQFEQQERKAQVEQLPIVVICNKGYITSDHAWLKTRQHAVLRTPVPIKGLIETINGLLA